MTEITYRRDGFDKTFRSTPCPSKLAVDKFSEGNPDYFHGTMVGSQNCLECKHFGGEVTDSVILCGKV